MLGEGGEVAGAVAQQRAQKRRTQERKIAGAARFAPAFLVFAPRDVTAVVVGAFDFPVAASACEPLARGQGGALERGDEQASVAALDAGFLVEGLAGDGDDGGGVGKAELFGRDAGEGQRAMFGAAVLAVVGEKRGTCPCTAWAAWARTAGQLSLSWMR